MNKKLPFEKAVENKLQQLSTPDETQAWKDMQLLLDKNKKRFIVRWDKKLLLLLLLLVPAAWWIVPTTNNSQDNKKSNDNFAIQQQNETINTTNLVAKESKATNSTLTKSAAETNIPVTINTTKISSESNKTNNAYATVSSGSMHEKNRKKKTNGKAIFTVTDANQDERLPNTDVNNKNSFNHNDDLDVKQSNADEKTADPVELSEKNKDNKRDVAPNQLQNATTSTEGSKLNNAADKTAITAEPKKAASLLQKDSAADDSNALYATASTTNHSKSIRKKSLQWSAGIGLQQQLPTGNKITMDGFNGSSNILQNYLPGIFLRAEKNRWFAEANFNYAVPLAEPNRVYSRKTTADNNTHILSVNSLTLRKMFYHQASLSINYNILPNWSVGTGATFGLLHRVISTEQTNSIDIVSNQLHTSTITNANGYSDSFFYRSNLKWLMQTQYQWKCFSIGLRFTNDLQPFMKYTSPEGEKIALSNASLDLLLRFRIWRAGK